MLNGSEARKSATAESQHTTSPQWIIYISSTVWNPHCSKPVTALRKFYRKAASFVRNGHRNSLRAGLGDKSHQLKCQSTWFYKISTGQAYIHVWGWHLKGREGKELVLSNLYYQNKNKIPPRTDYRNNTFIPHRARDWKELPPEAVQSLSHSTFILRVSSTHCKDLPSTSLTFHPSPSPHTFYVLFCFSLLCRPPKMTVMIIKYERKKKNNSFILTLTVLVFFSGCWLI